MAAPSTEQVGIDFRAKVGFDRSITAASSGSSTFTFTDEDNLVGDLLTEGDSVIVSGSTSNDGTYTIATGGIDTGTTDETTITVDESVSDDTGDGTILWEKEVGGATDGTYTVNHSLVTVTNKQSGRWQENLPTIRDASIDFSGGFIESSQQTGDGLTVEVSTDGGSTYESLGDVTSISLALSMALIDRTDVDSNRWRELLPDERSTELTVEKNYVDPENDTALNNIRTQAASGSSIDIKVTLNSFIYEATFYLSSESDSQPMSDAVTSSLSFTQSDTAPSITTTSNDVAVQAIIAAMTASPAEVMAVKESVVDADGNVISGATYREGDFYPESLTIDIPYDGEATMSGTLQNDGAVSESTQ